jgi:hypothetical protein
MHAPRVVVAPASATTNLLTRAVVLTPELGEAHLAVGAALELLFDFAQELGILARSGACTSRCPSAAKLLPRGSSTG